MIHSIQQRLISTQTDYRKTSVLFCKSLVLYTLAKMILTWPVGHLVMTYHSLPLPTKWFTRILFAPSFLAVNHINLFYGISIGFLLTALFVRWTYVVSLPFFWLCFNLMRVNRPIGNGSDFVLLMLSFWAIGMVADAPGDDQRSGRATFFSFTVIMCQIQVVGMYLISGWDKLLSSVWRSGDAIQYIARLDFEINPILYGFSESAFMNVVLAWSTILFELSFVILVWIKRTRLTILCIGVIFHLVIWIALSLPDFALIMMITYLIFLVDSDYYRLVGKIRMFRRTIIGDL